jgi:two-component system, chemotaxis family, chemotaxis protein CheY
MAKVLVVDDSAFARARVAKMLSDAGYSTCEAGDGYQAVAAYAREKPDAVLMDITMPGMDGLAALSAIHDADPGARVAMLTAMGQQSIVMDAIKRGARDFVTKPPQEQRLLEAVAKLVAT